jgi:hypothetical protein
MRAGEYVRRLEACDNGSVVCEGGSEASRIGTIWKACVVAKARCVELGRVKPERLRA